MKSLRELVQVSRQDPVTGQIELLSPSAQIDALLERDDANLAIRGLDPQELFGLVHRAGMNDGWELVMRASGEQVQYIVDFDCWSRDSLLQPRLTHWLEALFQRSDEGVAEMLQEMDLPVFTLWMREHCQVFIWQEDRDLIDLIDLPVLSSPDGVYAIAVPDEDRAASLIRLMLDRIYAQDIVLGHRLLEAVRWETSTDLSEFVFTQREARLGDLGFVPFSEAIEVFAWLDSTKWRAKARSNASKDKPTVLVGSTGFLEPTLEQGIVLLSQSKSEKGTTPFGAAMSALEAAWGPEFGPQVADSVNAQFRALVNRVFIAELANPGDVKAARESANLAADMLNIAIELVAGDDVTLAARVLGTNRLMELHRAGFSACARLQHEARKLSERGNLGLTDDALSLLQSAESDLMRGLMMRRPLRSLLHREGFERLADVERAAASLSKVALQELLFFGLKKWTKAQLSEYVYDETRSLSPVEMLSFRSLIMTAAIRLDAGLGADLGAVSLAQLETTLSRWRGDDFIDAAQSALEAWTMGPGMEQVAGLTKAWCAEVALWFSDELEEVVGPIPAEIAQGLVLLDLAD